MPSKHCRKQTSQARQSEPNQTNQRLAKFCSRQNSLVFFCSKLLMFQQEAELSRMSRLAKVSLRENSSYSGTKLPMLHQEADSWPGRVIKTLLFGQIRFFITALLAGLLTEAKLQQARLTKDKLGQHRAHLGSKGCF